MVDFLFVALYLSFPILVIVLMKKIRIDLFQVTIPSFVILSMFAFAYAGTLPLYFGWDAHRYAAGIQDKMIVLNVFIYTSWSILALIFGFIFSKYVLGIHSLLSVCGSLRPLKKSELKVVFLLLLFCFAILFLYLLKVPNVALFTVFSNGIKEASLARSLMGNGFAGKYHWYHLVMHHFLNVVTFTFFANWLIVKCRLNFLLFFVAFVGSTFTAVMTVEKAPFAWLLIGMWLTFLLVRRDGKISILSLSKLAVPLLGSLVFFYLYFMGSHSPVAALMSVLSRTFTGGVQPAYHYLEFFPQHHAFLMGKSFPNPMGILPFEPYHLTVEVMNWRFPALINSGVVGSMPTVFWGELYANFGVLGVLVLPVFVGIGLHITTYLVARLESTPLKVGLFVWLVLHYKNLAETGLGGFMLDLYLVSVVGVVLILITLTNNLKIKIQRTVF